MGYALRIDEAREQDRGMLSAYIARGTADVEEVSRSLATDGAVASFERALGNLDLDELPEPDEEALVATITNLQAWAAAANSRV